MVDRINNALFRCAAALALFCAGALGATPPAGSDARMRGREAEALLALIQKGAFEAAVESFSDGFRARTPPDRLAQYWNSLQTRFGQIRVIAARPGASRVEELEMVVVALEFERGALDVHVAYDATGRVAAMTFLPASDPAPSASAARKPEAGTPQSEAEDMEAVVTGGGSDATAENHPAWIEEAVTIISDIYKLPGTLTLPTGPPPFPAVVFIHDTGVNDRDETIGPNKPFRDIARGLAARGIASVRYDKRTFVYLREIDRKSMTWREEVVDDAVAAVRTLRNDDRVRGDGIFLIGHGLGGQLVPATIERARAMLFASDKIPSAMRLSGESHVAGAVIMAGAARPLMEPLIEMMRRRAAEDGEASLRERAQIMEIQNRVEKMRASRDPDHPPVAGVHYAYLEAFDEYDCLKTAQRFKRPLFIAQGGRDIQVQIETDFELWKKALARRSDVTFKVYPYLNHLFISGRGPGTFAEYERPGVVAEAFIADTAEWIHRIAKNQD